VAHSVKNIICGSFRAVVMRATTVSELLKELLNGFLCS
jgi:hypothetical protein